MIDTYRLGTDVMVTAEQIVVPAAKGGEWGPVNHFNQKLHVPRVSPKDVIADPYYNSEVAVCVVVVADRWISIRIPDSRIEDIEALERRPVGYGVVQHEAKILHSDNPALEGKLLELGVTRDGKDRQVNDDRSRTNKSRSGCFHKVVPCLALHICQTTSPIWPPPPTPRRHGLPAQKRVLKRAEFFSMPPP